MRADPYVDRSISATSWMPTPIPLHEARWKLPALKRPVDRRKTIPGTPAAIERGTAWIAARNAGMKVSDGNQGVEMNFENQDTSTFWAKHTDGLEPFRSRRVTPPDRQKDGVYPLLPPS